MPPQQVPKFELRADDLFAMYALQGYYGKIKAARLDKEYQRYVEDVIEAFETWRGENHNLVVIPSPP